MNGKMFKKSEGQLVATSMEGLFLSRLQSHAENSSKENLDHVRKFFSSQRKFANYVTHEVTGVSLSVSKPVKLIREFFPVTTICQVECNPFSIPADRFVLDLLSDSGTGLVMQEQEDLAQVYGDAVPSKGLMFSYAQSTPRGHLDVILKACFGAQFNFYPTLQGRAAERMLLQAFLASGLLKKADKLLSNRPFDTTYGHITAAGLQVSALTPQCCPKRYYEASSVFIGNIDEKLFTGELDSSEMVLITMTDNGGGGQPVSFANYKFLVEKTRAQNKLIWVDACRIFENALFIKAFEPGYEDRTIKDIVQEILSLADCATMSFKKMYAHSGGAILINKASPFLQDKELEKLDALIKMQTTADYGNGYHSYAGLTGASMVEVMTGLITSVDEAITGERIAQVGRVNCYMRQKFPGFPILAGGHALYIAADEVLPMVPMTNCPAEYLNVIMMHTIRTRGAGLGHLMYGGRAELPSGKIVFRYKLPLDALRLAIPRNLYSDDELISQLSVIGEAFVRGAFRSLKAGLSPIDYIDNGFYHFGAKYNFVDEEEFLNAVDCLTCTDT
ncbi:tryptophanase-like [Lineus longissimus]|uniref:tryptophanase-like n=1 Tax=Lineus longissimus TaxID=88925 RepID=UPI002B4DF40A